MFKRMTILANPFFLYSVTWIIVLTVYELGWSEMCPPLSNNLLFFIWITILSSLIISLFFQKKGFTSFIPQKSIPHKLLSRALKILYFLFICEIIYARGIPLLSLIRGDSSILYTEFGLPFVHVLVVNGLSLVFIISYYSLKSTHDKATRRKLKLYMLYSLIPFVFIVNRGAIMNNILGAFIITLITTSHKKRAVGIVILSGFSVLFLFGLMGNLRSDVNNTSNAILLIGRATNEFRESIIPKEFFWGYLYIATPLANTQNTIDHCNLHKIDLKDLGDLVLHEATPAIISKRIGENNKSHTATLIVRQLNVSSVYGRIYTYIGWPGLYLMFFFMLFFIVINLGLVSKTSLFYVPMIVVIDEIIIMNLFDNMFVFMGLVPQALFLIIASKFIKIKR